jgi:hypothetical protein
VERRETFDKYMAGLERLWADDDTTDLETSAVDDVYRLLLLKDVGEMAWKPGHHATRIHDRSGLQELITADLVNLLAPFEQLEDDGDLLVSPNASSAIAEALCRGHPAQIVNWVLEEEEEHRRSWTKRGKPAGVDGEKRSTSAEWEWLMNGETYRPIYELLRSWAGHRAVTAHERRVAAEAELHRLEVFAEELIDALRKFRPHWSDTFEERMRQDRIGPETIRPLVERPLDLRRFRCASSTAHESGGGDHAPYALPRQPRLQIGDCWRDAEPGQLHRQRCARRTPRQLSNYIAARNESFSPSWMDPPRPLVPSPTNTQSASTTGPKTPSAP